MRTINSSILSELEAKELTPFYLLYMNIDSTEYCITDADVPIVYDSDTYNPRGFSFEPVKYSLNNIVDQVAFEIDNLDDYFTYVFTGDTPQGSEIVLYLVAIDSTGGLAGDTVFTVFDGEIGPWTKDESILKVTATSLLSRWGQRTLSKHSASCRWKVFKGTECSYSGGEDWCDRTYERCAALVNTANFGGFRWLPEIEDKEIWWGKVPANA